MTSQELRQHVVVITDHLACDTYGGVEAIKWARNSYNDRHPAHVILDLTNEFGSKLWLGGSKAGTDTNLMIRNGIGAVWPAAKSVQPDDTAAIRVLRYTDGTGVVHGNVNMESVLQQIDNVISLLHRGVSVLICCVNGAHRSATLGAMTLMRLLGWSATEVANYVSTLRNIVDLNSRAPPSQYRVNTIRPIDFLIEHQAEIAGKSGASGLVQVGSNQEIFPSTRYANALITPVQFRRRCIEMGFVLSGKGKRTRQSLPGPQSLISSMPPPPPPGQVRQSGTNTDSSYINVPTVSAASADDEAVDPPVMVEIEVADDEENEEPTVEKACEKGAAEAEEPESDFEMVTCDDEGKVADVNPESPPQTPRANWTSEDFARLETVMRDLGHLNRQLLSFNNAEVEEDQAQADDQASASGPVSDQIAEPGQQAAEADEPGGTSADPVESDEVARDEALGQVDDEPATPATAESGEPLEPSSLDLEKTMEALKAQAAEGDKDEMLGRLFGLLETQKVQQQALLSRLQSRQEMDERKNVIFTALYNRDMTRLRAELQALTVSDLVSIRDEEGMTVAHHAVRLGLGPCLEYTLRKAPTLADAVTNPSGRPANWTPLMVLVDAPPGSLGGTDYAYDMLKVLVSYMSVTGLVNLGPFKSPTGATAFHIAASRGNHRGLQKLLWSLYHKSGGDRNSTYAFGLVTSLVNSPGLKRGQGVVDAALANNIDLAMYVKRNWGGVELLSPPSRGGYAA
ncbi:DSPTP1 [Symbiodinium sp. CCMP2592]|nr:DSPTP1 [Symbiodinium sp. CCMP2592]